MSNNLYTWTDNPTVSGVAVCDTDILNDCLMHLKYDKQDGNGFPLFTPMIFDHVLSGNDAVGWALQGSVVSNTYPDAVSKIQELYTEGVETQYRNITCKRSVDGRYIADIEQKPAIDQLFTLTGIADFYIWDSINQQFYLPRTKWFNQMTPDTSMVNNYNEPGLPNITGDAGGYSPTGSRVVSGSFYLDNDSQGWGDFDADAPCIQMKFDAARSSAVYGVSDTVQPPSSNKLLYYKVGNTLTNESDIDVANLTNDVLNVQNSLADKIGKSECPAYIVETYKAAYSTYPNIYSWYRLWSDGWLEQGGYHHPTTFNYTTELVKPYGNTSYYVNMIRQGTELTPSFSVRNGLTSFTTNTSMPQDSAWFFWYSCGYVTQGE